MAGYYGDWNVGEARVKIAITTGTFHPESGGPPTYLHRLGRELLERGHDVRLLTFGEPTGDRYAHPVTRISRRLPIPARLALYTTHAARLIAWADVVFVSDYGLPAAVVTRLIRRPVVLKVVGDFAWESAVRRGWVPRALSIDDFQRMPKRGRSRLLERLQRYYATRADRVIVPSEYLAGIVAGWGVEAARVRVVHNAVDVGRFDVSETPEEARSRLGLPAGRIALSVSRLTAWKGVDECIRAVAALRTRHDLHLVHCGDGPDEERLRDLARQLEVSERVHFRGRVAREEIPLYFRAADLFVLYSTYEGLAHVLLEAMAARVPTIVSDRGGNVEVVQDGITGRVVSRADPRRFVDAIDVLLSDPPEGARLAEQARHWVEARFGWPRLVDQTLAVLAEARSAAATTPG